MKCLDINITKYVKGLYAKTLIKEIKYQINEINYVWVTQYY